MRCDVPSCCSSLSIHCLAEYGKMRRPALPNLKRNLDEFLTEYRNLLHVLQFVTDLPRIETRLAPLLLQSASASAHERALSDSQ